LQVGKRWQIAGKTKDYSGEPGRISLNRRLQLLTILLTVPVRESSGFVGIMVAVSGGHQVGGEVAAELAAWVKSHTAVAMHAARMLPRLPGVVPMEAKLGQLAAGLDRGLLLELHPHPPAHHLGQFKERGEPPRNMASKVSVSNERFTRLRAKSIRASPGWRSAAEADEVILPDRLPSSSKLCDLVFMVFFCVVTLHVFGPSLFTRKPSPRPSCVGVVFRGHRTRRAGVIGRGGESDGARVAARKEGPENAPTLSAPVGEPGVMVASVVPQPA
jgi:hypothetical protein